MTKAFDSSIVNLEIKDTILNFLPPYFRTTKNNMFFNTSINELFRKGDGEQIKGYIGTKPDWYNPTTDFYINESNNDRNNYQLEPTMVSYDQNKDVDSAVYISDYIKNLQVDGALTTNQNRLFEQEYVSWAPPVQIDMLINYRLYYWYSDETTVPDYITIDPSSKDGNPWSIQNMWKHIDWLNENNIDYTKYSKAVKPIICFIPNIELYNYGTYRRHDATFYDPTITSISSLFDNAKSITIDGTIINEEYITENGPVYVLISNDTDYYSNNILYEIVWAGNKLRYQIYTDGQDPTGIASNGEIIKITNGTYSGKEYYFDGISWNIAQSKEFNTVSAPLFNLYAFDYDFNTSNQIDITDNDSYVSLTNTSIFPNSNFNGNKIFSYSIDEDEYYQKDSILGLYINLDSSGDLLFENYISTITYSYVENLITKTINGFYFFKVNDIVPYYSNNWYKKTNLSKQWMVDEYVFDGTNNLFTLSQVPYYGTSSDEKSKELEQAANIEVIVSSQSTDNVSVFTSKVLTYDIDFVVYNNTILIYNLSKNDLIKIRTYNPNTPSTDYSGYYEIPISLSGNCTYQDLSTFTLGSIWKQCSEIMENQNGFTGSVYGSNSYRNIVPDLSYGNSIIETSSSLLLGMSLVSNDSINVPSSYRYVSDQYRIFKFNFINRVSEYYSNGILTSYSSNIDEIINDILSDISRGKTTTSPFYNSKMGVTDSNTIDYFIPPTPAFLGLTKPTVPYITYDYSAPTTPLVLVGHDGSQVLLYDSVNLGTMEFSDPRDYVLYMFENRLYESINYIFKQDTYKPFDIKNYISNGFNTDNEYSITEWNQILEQNFLYWSANNNLDYRINSTYDAANPFTWNWSSVISAITGDNLLGAWRGIYNYYYGTDAPHYKPWEMLGFTVKPDYWDATYGPAPYTSANKIMWSDIENGIIVSGDLKGTYDNLKRIGLQKYLPVDEQGYLLDPFMAGIALNYPNSADAQSGWEFGDISPIENVWRRTSEYAYAVQLASYLAKPSMYLSSSWDTYNIRILNYGLSSEQWINIETLNRPSFSEYTVHGETIDNKLVYHYGMQNIISNYIISQSLNVTAEFGNIIRGLDVKIGYRFGGFVDSDNMTITSEAYGVLPKENTNVYLYESPTTENIFYSGIFVLKQYNGWKVYGYDTINPYFKIYEVDDNSTGYSINVENVATSSIYEWQEKSYYKKGQLVIYYGNKYVSIEDHISSSFFESKYWQQVSHNLVANSNSVEWFTTLKNTNIKNISYGTLITSYQDMCNLMNGMQNYYESVGIRFDQSNNYAWSDIITSFIKWDMTVTNEENSFAAFSPLNTNVTINNGFGNIKDIFNVYDSFYGIIDVTGKNIKENNLRVVRGQSYTSVIPTDDVSEGIYGCRFYKNSIEHMLLVDNETIFGDTLNSTIFNVMQARLRIETFKTTDWTGKMLAPGFIVSGNTILPNFDTTAENFRDFYNIKETFYNSLQERTRLNIGYFNKEYFDNMMVTSTNQFEYYQGMIQHKGTSTVINRLMRSNFISNNRNLTFSEEWALRVGTYGADNIDKNFDLYITQSNFDNNPQLFEFNTQTYINNREYIKSFSTNSDIYISLNDIESITEGSQIYNGTVKINSINILFDNGVNGLLNLEGISNNKVYINDYNISNGSISIDINDDIPISVSSNDFKITCTTDIEITIYINFIIEDIIIDKEISNHIIITDIIGSDGKLIQKDESWAWRLFGNSIEFPTKYYDLKDKNFLPTAGYVSIDTIDWTSVNIDNFIDLYNTTSINNPPESITKTFTFDLTGSPRIITTKLIDGKDKGYFRINSLKYNVTKGFSYDVVMNIGTPSQLPKDPTTNNFSDDVIYRIGANFLSTITTVTEYPTSYIDQTQEGDNGIYIQIDCSKIIEIPNNINLGSVTITLTLDWIYDSILPNNRAWIYNTGEGDWKTYKLYNPNYIIDNISSNLQGNPVLSFYQNYMTDNNISLQTVLPESSYIIIDGVQNNTQFTSTYSPRYNNNCSTLIDGSKTSTNILSMNSTAGMKIKTMYINVLKAFETTDGSELDITIGTTDNSSLIGDSSVISNPFPSTPSFNQTSPVTVQVANKDIIYLSHTNTVQVYITRSGNIYNVPNQCDSIPDTSFTWTLYGTINDQVDTTNKIQSGNITFGNPDNEDDSKESYWLSTLSLTLTNNLTQYALVISDVNGGTLGTNSTTFIELSGTSESYVLFDPTQLGLQQIDPTLINLSIIDDYLTFNTGGNTTGSAYVTIDYEYTNGFEIVDIDKTDITLSGSGNGGMIFQWVPTRFGTIDEFTSSVFYPFAYEENDYIEIDNNNNLWNICTVNQSKNLDIYVQQTPQINTNLIENAIVYNNETQTTEQILEIFDPLKGYIPGIAKQYIDYILSYDPARYNKTNTSITLVENDSWGYEEVGKLWWNTTNSIYLDYEISDYEYKWKNWGKLAPEASIDIYEWVCSPVIPSAWNTYVSNGQYSEGFSQNPSGTVDDSANTNWVEEIYYDEIKNITIIYYYFWVKLPTTCGKYERRQLSATQISNIIENPKSNDLSYISVIDTNKLIIGGIEQFIDDNNTILKVNWKTTESENNFHKQWMLIKEDDDQIIVDSSLWNKFVNSIVGYKTVANNSTLSFTLEKTFYETSTSITISGNQSDMVKIPYSGQIKIGKYWLTYNKVIGNVIYGLSNTTGNIIEAGTSVVIDIISNDMIQVPNPSLTSFESVGLLDRPVQSMFALDEINGIKICSREARKMCILSINDILSEQPYLDTWYEATTLFSTYDQVANNIQYIYKVNDFEYRNALINNGLKLEDTVLVEGNTDSDNFWTLWKYSPYDYNSDNYGFVLINTQKWRLQEGELWNAVDWYATGYSSSDYPQYIFDNINDLNENIYSIDSTLLNGTLIMAKTQNANDLRWSWLVYDGGSLTEVAKEKSTIQLSSQFYTSNIDYGITNNILSNIVLRDGTYELQIILGYFYNTLMNKLQINQLFFNMIKSALSLNKYNDWIFKTSFMYIGGCYEQLKQLPIVESGTIDNIITYIDNVKPYHVKIRDYVATYTIGPDIAQMNVIDFDFPSYYDSKTNTTRTLYPSVEGQLNYNNEKENSDDTVIASTMKPWLYWYDNYQNTNYDSSNLDSNWNPVRHNKIGIKFDRIACKSNIGWDSSSWDSLGISYDQENPNGIDTNQLVSELRTEYKNYGDMSVNSLIDFNKIDTSTLNVGCIVFIIENNTYKIWNNKWITIYGYGWDSDIEESGAIDRIYEYYNPTGEQIHKTDIENLMSGCGFSGTDIKGGTIETGSSFMFPWDYSSGFDNEKGYYMGGDDQNSIIVTNPLSQANGINNPLTTDVIQRDNDLSSKDLSDTSTSLSSDIDVTGTTFGIQPVYKSPEEKITIKCMDSIVITVTDNISTGNAVPFRMSKNNFGMVDLISLNNNGVTVNQDGGTYIDLNVSGDLFPLHDPANPTTEYLNLVNLTMVDMNMSKEDIDSQLGRNNPGIIWINGEKIIYWSVSNINGIYRISDLIRGYGITDQKVNSSGFNELSTYQKASSGDIVYDGTLVNWATQDNNPKVTITDTKWYIGNIRIV